MAGLPPRLKEKADMQAMQAAASNLKMGPKSIASAGEEMESMADTCKCPECGYEGPESTFKQEAPPQHSDGDDGEGEGDY